MAAAAPQASPGAPRSWVAKSLRFGAVQVRMTTHMRMLLLILLLMSVAAINYQSNAGWALVMMLVSIIGLSILHARRNLNQVTVVSGAVPPCFAGSEAEAEVTLISNGVAESFDITVSLPELQSSGHCSRVAASGQTRCQFNLSARKRGVIQLQRVRISTTFPLGLLEISRDALLPLECVVYPAAVGRWALPRGVPMRMNVRLQQSQGAALNQGADDFLGHRRYVAGESRRQIDWKAHARGVPLMIKRFTGTSTSEVWCDWNATRGTDEERLSQLSRWVVEADQSGSRFGLRLPTRVLPPGQGLQHYQTCMRILAEQPQSAP
jgi:uncharacterized protein (DUF58 family)